MTIENLQIEVQASADKATARLEKLEAVLKRIDAIGKNNGFDEISQKLKKLASPDFSDTAKGIDDTAKSANRLGKANSRVEKFSKAMKTIRGEAEKTTDEFSRIARVSELPIGIESVKEKQTADTVNLPKAVSSVEPRFKFFTRYLKDISTHGKKAGGAIAYLGKTVSRFLIYKALNLLIRGINTGLQNMAMYSKEANQVLTQYKTLNLQLSNSLGAALIPILNMLYPLVERIANGIIDVVNNLNILFSALSGSKTFYRAKKYVDDYAESLGKVKGLAGMDQIHTIGKTYNYGEMFEEVEIDNTALASARDSIIDLVGGFLLLKMVLDGIGFAKRLATLTDQAVNFSSVLKNIFKYFAGICLIVIGATELFKGIFSAWKDGVDWKNFTRMLLGIALIVGGIALAFGFAAAIVALALSGVLLFAVGLKDIITNEKNLKNTLMVLAGILIVGAGIALAFGGWIPLAIAAAVAALAGIAIWGDEIAAWLDNLKGLFDNWVVTVKEKITGFFDNLIDKVKNVSPELAGILEYIKNIFISVIDWFKAKIDWLINTCRNFVKIIRDLFRGDFKAVWEDLKQYFKDWWQGLVNIFIAPLNFLISCFESFVNFFIRGINKIIGGLNSLSFDMPDWLGGGHFGLNLKLVDEANFGRINELGTSSSSGKGLLSSSYSGAAGGFSNSKTVVDNNEQIVEGISRGVSDANAEQNTLLREQNKLLTQMLHSSGGGTVPVSTITKGLERQNRRNGKVIVPVGN